MNNIENRNTMILMIVSTQRFRKSPRKIMKTIKLKKAVVGRKNLGHFNDNISFHSLGRVHQKEEVTKTKRRGRECSSHAYDRLPRPRRPSRRSSFVHRIVPSVSSSCNLYRNIGEARSCRLWPKNDWDSPIVLCVLRQEEKTEKEKLKGWEQYRKKRKKKCDKKLSEEGRGK